MKRPLVVFLPLLLSLISLIVIVGCAPQNTDPYIDCDIQSLVDAINNANADPVLTTIELNPGCTYVIDERYGDYNGLPEIISELVIVGNGATITRPSLLDQPIRYRIFKVESSGSLSLSGFNISGGTVIGSHIVNVESNYGGAILNKGELTIQDMVFEENIAVSGGALAIYAQGTFNIDNSVFRNNEARQNGGAIFNNGTGTAQINTVLFENNQATGQYMVPSSGRGGAIYNISDDMVITDSKFIGNESLFYGGVFVNSSNTLEINRSIISGNSAQNWDSVLFNSSGQTIISNSTISGNNSGSLYNAIRNGSGSISIAYSTITENSGDSPAIVSSNDNITIENSIIVNNPGGDCDSALSITALGNNIDSDGSCSGFITTDPQLGPLADNGGGTQTHALDPNSPAINLASGGCPAADQRGVARPYGNACDVGAYESETGTSVCDIQELVDAINAANANPDPTTIELTPGCIYVVDQKYQGPDPIYGETSTGLPFISTEVIIEGNGATITRPQYSGGVDRYRFFFIKDTGSLSLSNCLITKGYVDSNVLGSIQGCGGAIYNNGDLEVSNVTFEDNSGTYGGAVSNEKQGNLVINDSTFSENRGTHSGGAIHHSSDGDADIRSVLFYQNFAPKMMTDPTSGIGGAIDNEGDMLIEECVFDGNHAYYLSGAIFNTHNDLVINNSLFVNNTSEYGESVLGNGVPQSNIYGHIYLTNSTLSGNRSFSSDASAIHVYSGTLDISFSTITGNIGSVPAVRSGDQPVTISNSIIANNIGGNCDPSYVLDTAGRNLDSDGSCQGFTLTADPLLEPLADNGGLTLTHALSPESPAIDQAQGACPAADQRGVTRPQSFFCDLGAYESEDVETCSIHYLVNAINFANSDPDHTIIELEPGCTYLVDQQYGDRQSGLPQLTTPITIHGNGATLTRPGLEQQPDEYRFFYVELGTTVSISDLTLSSGVITGTEGINDDSDSHGGAIFNRGVLSLTGITFQANQALFGGALANNSRGGLTLSDSVFQENQASRDGGALYLGGRGGAEISGVLFEDNQAQGESSGGQGGAIYNQYDLTLSGSTLSANDSRQGGGGVYNSGEMDLVSCTLGRNSASQAGGSALQNQSGNLSVLNSTLSGNQTGPGDLYTVYNGGGLIRISYSTVTAAEGGAAALGGSGNLDSYRYEIINSIVAMNPPGDCAPGIAITVFGNNLDSDGSCSGFSHTGDPLLQPLADNGGGTWTHAIPMASPALNAASVECPISDQRGVSRPQGSACDLGAFEYDGTQPTPSPTPEVDACIFEALQNTNCRLSDCTRAGLVAFLPMGDPARLLGLNPQGSHGLFELPSGVECWMLMSLLTGGDAKVCNPIIAIPPPCPTPEVITCNADLGEDACVEAGGTYHPPTASAAWCECP